MLEGRGQTADKRRGRGRGVHVSLSTTAAEARNAALLFLLLGGKQRARAPASRKPLKWVSVLASLSVPLSHGTRHPPSRLGISAQASQRGASQGGVATAPSGVRSQLGARDREVEREEHRGKLSPLPWQSDPADTEHSAQGPKPASPARLEAPVSGSAVAESRSPLSPSASHFVFSSQSHSHPIPRSLLASPHPACPRMVLVGAYPCLSIAHLSERTTGGERDRGHVTRSLASPLRHSRSLTKYQRNLETGS